MTSLTPSKKNNPNQNEPDLKKKKNKINVDLKSVFLQCIWTKVRSTYRNTQLTENF